MEAENKRTLKGAIGSFIFAALFGTSLLFIPLPLTVVPLALALMATWCCIFRIIILLINWEVDGKL